MKNHNPLRHPTPNEEPPLKWPTMIIYCFGAFLLILLVWAYFAKVDDIVVADGKVIPSSQEKVIQSFDGGILSAIEVDEGNEVKKGQILVRLDVTRYQSDYQKKYIEYIATLAKVNRLQAEADAHDSIQFSAELNAYSDIKKQEIHLFETRKQSQKEELDNLQRSYELANEEVKMYQTLIEKGVVTKLDLLRSKRNLEDIQSKIFEKKNNFLEQVKADLNQFSAIAESTKKELDSLHDKMERTTIRSPIDGIVKKIHIVTIGGVITPGMDIMGIVPKEDTLLIEAQVSPTDIAFVHLDQDANVKINAYDYSIYGSLEGKVVYISADSLEDEKANPALKQLRNFYLIHIRTVKNHLGSEKHILPIIPGMTANIHIKTGQKTVLQYMLKPLIKAKMEALRER